MKLKIRPAARRDLVRAAGFYEEQEEGVGGYFLDTLYSEIDSLMLFGGIHPVHFGRYHRLLSRKFPPSLLLSTTVGDPDRVRMSDPDMRVSETPPTLRQALCSNALGTCATSRRASPQGQTGATLFGPTGVN